MSESDELRAELLKSEKLLAYMKKQCIGHCGELSRLQETVSQRDEENQRLAKEIAELKQRVALHVADGSLSNIEQLSSAQLHASPDATRQTQPMLADCQAHLELATAKI